MEARWRRWDGRPVLRVVRGVLLVAEGEARDRLRPAD
jgi:hypothetical protein